MRPREVVREAWRDLTSGAAWALTSAVVLAVLLAAVVGLRAAASAADVRSAAAYVTSGAATMVQRAEGRVDGRVCDGFADSEGVLASGALRRVDQGAIPAVQPGSTVPTYEVTRGVARVLGATGSAGTAGVVISPGVRDALGLVAGDHIVMADRTSVPVTGVYAYPDDGRDPDLEYALLAPTLDDGHPFDACWVTVWPQRDDTVTMLRRTVLPTTGAEGEARPTIGQLNPRLGASFVPRADVPDSVPLGAAGAAGVVVGAAAVLRRRLALASDLHVGVPRSAQVLGVALQHVVWAAAASVVAVGVAVVVVRGLPAEDAVPIVRSAAGVAVVGLVGALAGGVLAASSIRERALHRYFRAR
ncbi:hypothetical protein [Curtobacterium pusillum]|uniref:hypothetical protein n=1 Tax=Curtobacterium pusillum TaxID=69373 RepID=UPI00119D01EC|nr:hypothetical protein [Curtobacterium pusillum]